MAFCVGSWPGADFENVYIARFLETLETAEISVVPVLDPFRAISKKIDVLHIHWPEKVFWGVGRLQGAFRAIFVLIGLVSLKIKRVKIVWSVHNLEPHDSGYKFMLFWRPYIFLVTLLVDGFVTLCPSTVEIVRGKFRNLASKPAIFLWHPDYKIPEQSAQKRDDWRKRFGIGNTDRVFAFIGQIRPYKGVEDLLECFVKVSDASAKLLIAGAIYDEQLRSKLQKYAAADIRIVPYLRHLSEDELAVAASSADVIVLPFRNILHSGSIIYALSAGKPVITPSTPFAVDLMAEVGRDWMHLYSGALSSDSFKIEEITCRGKPNLKVLSIVESGAKVKEFYLSL